MNNVLTSKIDVHRRLCIKKDLEEIELWMYTLECFNDELDSFHHIEKQLIKNTSVANTILAMRRNTTLMMANLCKYEQELKTEYEYGKVEYDAVRSKLHKQKRECYFKLIKEYNKFKHQIYVFLKAYHRK